MPTLRIILVEPREAGNVGAAARAMKNFGFDELWIVGEHPELLPVAGWWASGAEDLIAKAHFVPALQDALAGTHVTVATTSMRERTTPVSFTPHTLAETFASLADDQTLALVFGREDRGLTREELVLCQHTAAIPANDAFPTMNLAQALCVFCYELSSIAPAPRERPLPDAALVERLHQRARELLLRVGFLHADNPDRIYDDVRAMLARAGLDEREVTIALGIIRQIEWALGPTSDANPADSRR
ncbi:MAG TPA: RNA methyltransferase [Thermoanaerobaculia bacterium]|nr:RNA methyltransferase [Thermoanaerobaculia bacterium]